MPEILGFLGRFVAKIQRQTLMGRTRVGCRWISRRSFESPHRISTSAMFDRIWASTLTINVQKYMECTCAVRFNLNVNFTNCFNALNPLKLEKSRENHSPFSISICTTWLKPDRASSGLSSLRAEHYQLYQNGNRNLTHIMMFTQRPLAL